MEDSTTFTSKIIGFIIKHRLLVISLSAAIIFLIATAALLYYSQLPTEEPPLPANLNYDVSGTITIANLDDYQNYRPSNDFLEEVNQEIYKTINYNTDGELDGNSLTDINIRQDSYTENLNQKTGTYTVKYLIDIPSLQQSYQIYYKWGENHNTTPEGVYGPVVSCPTPKQLIYPEFACKDIFFTNEDGTMTPITNSTYADRFLTRITPYTAIISDRISYTAKTRFDTNDQPYIEISFNSCEASNLIETAKSSYATYLANFSLELSDFRVSVVTYECDF